MKFNTRQKKEEKQFLLAAVIHGVIIGAAGVLLFFFLLQVVEEKVGDSNGETLSVDSQKSASVENKPVKFYAMQYGVYSSSQAASDFLAAHPEFENVSIIRADKQFYLWGAISNSEKKIKSIVTKDSFVKPFVLNGAACEEKGVKIIPQLLAVDKVAKLNISDSKSGQATPVDWKTAVTTATKVSKELEIVKLMILEHYVSQNDCLQIKF